MLEFGVSQEVVTLGLSLFVLGFALGPLLWAPFSEIYGRQIVFVGTYVAFTAFNAGAAGAPNIYGLLILRFFAAAFGSSPLTNAGGVIADLFSANERGMYIMLRACWTITDFVIRFGNECLFGCSVHGTCSWTYYWRVSLSCCWHC